MVIGVIGNGMTLKVIKHLTVRTNGHILMAYLALSDILVNCMVPLAAFTDFSRQFEDRIRHWKNICLIKEYLYTTASGLSLISYCVLSVDR